MKKNPETRICVIGAGAAGLSAAYYLKEKGYRNVTVLERENSVGGKCRSFYCDGINHDMGAGEFTPFYRHTISLMKKLGVSPALVAPMKLTDINNLQIYSPWMLFNNSSIARVAWAIVRYLYLLLKNNRYLHTPGYRYLPDEMTRPFSEWIEAHGLDDIRNLFLIPLTCYGYGRLESIPAAYVLKYVNYKNMITMIKASLLKLCGINDCWPRRVREGFQYFLKKIENDLCNVQKDVYITRITRNGKPWGGVFVQVECETAPMEFDNLIIAFTPSTGAMKLAGFDMSSQEKMLFDRIIHLSYYSTACRTMGIVPGLHHALIQSDQIIVPEYGSPLLVYRQTDRSDIAIVYTLLDESDEKEELMKLFEIKDFITRKMSGTGKLVEILETVKWDYFPHVGTADLKDGFYGKFEAIQGENNTYYTGALLNFESVEHVIEYSKSLVDKYF